MDPLDLAIFRGICRERHHWWVGLDPRMSAEMVAGGLGVAGSTVRARLAHWERTGFLKAFDVMPNPALFGASLGAITLRLTSGAEKPRVLADLAQVPGIAVALDHVGARLDVVLAIRDATELATATNTVRSLPGIAEAAATGAPTAPPATVAPSAMDWRIVAEIRRTPRARAPDIAARARSSPRSFTRRYDALANGGAFLTWLQLDFARYPGTVARLLARVDAAQRPFIARELRTRLAEDGEVSPLQIAPVGDDQVEILLHRPNVAAMEDVEQIVLATPNVTAIETLYPRAVHGYPAWAERRLAEATGTWPETGSFLATPPRLA